LSSRNAWHEYFEGRKGDPARELEFYQAIDKLEREDPATNEKKLAALGFSLADVQAFITAGEPTAELKLILENIRARGLGGFVKVDYGIIRGLAYYTGIVFEAFARQEQLRAIAGGGRYDNLIKLLSGGKVDLPALGFGMGDVVLFELLKSLGLLPKFTAALDAFCLIEDEALRGASLQLIQELRSAGIAVDYSFTAAKSDKQFKRAQELNVSYTVKLERDAAGGLITRLKNLKTREEKTIDRAAIATELRAAR
jgi:histidyl-tRNA synthetase